LNVGNFACFCNFRVPVTGTWILDPGMVIYFFASLIEYYLYTNFHRNRRNFLWTDGRTDGHLTPILLGRLPNFGSQPKMETRHPVDGQFGREFPAISNHFGVMS